ncbi:SGNH/GDSL hydrolase family protein [Streptosporangium sp. NBC_01756]|uniref:SGNH/GDSL hydrolase family protein n=1 Tax=Streptosporangium sp. NBC_01756 TaxID=2975950 RepID=UPI002DDAA15D|nr:SGNH/GDSL hydrolase family protein [Streptosporangium sp. NBC_01756]WSC90085.1 SGNH/GDSL hydrolase family protein [Streptosporangium sp. NBC_01756]
MNHPAAKIGAALSALVITLGASAAGIGTAQAGIAQAGVAQAGVAQAGVDRQAAWQAAWMAAPQRASAGFEPNWSEEGFSRQSVRQVVRLTAEGSSVRIRLSNDYGPSAVRLTGATVAYADQGASVRPDSVRHLTFGRARSADIPAHGGLTSDPVQLDVRPFQSVAVTLYFAGTTGPATFHSQAYASSYRAQGDHRADTAASAFTQATHSWYYLSGVDVTGGKQKGDTVVAFGDSITDGFGSTGDANGRYPDELAERLAATGRARPVLNAGIGGNLVLNDSAWYGDHSAARFRRDVLDQPGVGTVVMLEGVNDIGFSESDTPTYKPAPVVSADELITKYRQLIQQAHAKGVKVVGATLLPFKNSDHWGEHAAAVSDAVNQWIRTSGEYDAVVDLDRGLAAPGKADVLNPAYDSGDHLHPNDAGYTAMARLIADRL